MVDFDVFESRMVSLGSKVMYKSLLHPVLLKKKKEEQGDSFEAYAVVRTRDNMNQIWGYEAETGKWFPEVTVHEFLENILLWNHMNAS